MAKLSRIAFVILLLTSVIVTIVNMVRQLHSVSGDEASALDVTLAMEIDTLKAKLQKEQTRTKNLEFQLRISMFLTYVLTEAKSFLIFFKGSKNSYHKIAVAN